MTTTLATAGAIVERRLNLNAGLASTPPTSAFIIDDLRDAFRFYFGVLQPIFMTSTTVSATFIATLTTPGTIQHVVFNRLPLYRHEYGQSSTGIKVAGHHLGRGGDTIVIYYTSAATIASGATTVDSTCIHGGDWLETICILYAEMMALLRLSRTSDSGNGVMQLQAYRTLERRLEQMEGALRQARDRDLTILQAQLQDRANWGPGVFAQSGLAGFDSDVETPNYTTGSV